MHVYRIDYRCMFTRRDHTFHCCANTAQAAVDRCREVNKDICVLNVFVQVVEGWK